MKKLFVFLLVAIIAIGSLFAMGGGEQVQETRPDVVPLKVWYSISGTNGKFFEGQVAEFQKQHPEIQIELTYTGSYADSNTKIAAAKLAGNAPDLIITSASQIYPGQDEDYTMEELISDPEFNINDIQSGIMEYAKFNNRITSLPFGISTQVIYYNKDLLSKAGIDFSSTQIKTWPELMDIARAVMDATGASGFDTSDPVWLIKSMLYQNNNKVVEVVNERVTPVFQNESGIEVAEYWKSLIDSGVMEAATHSNAEKKFLAGNLAFIAATSNRISRWAGSTEFELGAIEMPAFKSKAVALGGSTTTIMAKDKWEKEAAWELIKFILNTDNQTDFALTSGYLPIRKSSLDRADVKEMVSNNELYNIAIKQLDYAWAYTHFGEMGTMDNLLWYAIDDIEHGTKTPKDAFENAAKELEMEIE